MPLTCILPLGDPRLRTISLPVADPCEPGTRQTAALLARTLASFRAQCGFGHGIAAPQLGIPLRMVAVITASGTEVLCNPAITGQSARSITLWDSCMCFPSLLVRVRRPASLSVTFSDLCGREQSWERLDPWLSILLAHEIDHLDGILAVDHAIDRESLISREAYEADPVFYQQKVDRVERPAYEARP